MPSDLTEVWRRLIADLTEGTYLRDVAALLRQPVASGLEIRLVRHAGGDWLSPHTDRADKLFSHIFYFTRGWRAEWGGCLEILEGDDPASVAGRVVPELGASALLARADNSWHQVSRVRGAPPVDRTSLLVHGRR
ncbi:MULTISPECIES: 2OG-Fe(II) oxygenase family protein [unclassified Amycolatopsis]|uniref:2OG-Fe(II) oxygenase family protein n=1 Tax=unclassified Amycolatopsis TaxID=2618356 RepID=UPI0028767658|nr:MULTISPECIES: 2OG-Fe(II) oxygenase family protein [unclassified Amycolatopsis]MDS0139290.1 2OG-Fe(II) oxygenase [Amycolatopsis sp. 505]MDS0144522.1 2OG-Fe(II) oxygenase [Amycolatopsis sp. CM201R]